MTKELRTRTIQEVAPEETFSSPIEQTPRESPTIQLLTLLRTLREMPEDDRWPEATWPTPEAFEDARVFIKRLPLMDIQIPEIRLTHDGEINFLWNTSNYHVDLGFYGTGTYSYFGCNAQGVKVLDEDVPADSSLAKPIMDLLAGEGKGRTEFILDTTGEAAEQVLFDRRLYLLDDEGFAAFEAALTAPIEPSEALRKTMNTPASWDEK